MHLITDQYPSPHAPCLTHSRGVYPLRLTHSHTKGGLYVIKAYYPDGGNLKLMMMHIFSHSKKENETVAPSMRLPHN